VGSFDAELSATKLHGVTTENTSLNLTLKREAVRSTETWYPPRKLHLATTKKTTVLIIVLTVKLEAVLSTETQVFAHKSTP
jgi:hypothetical protein